MCGGGGGYRPPPAVVQKPPINHEKLFQFISMLLSLQEDCIPFVS